MEGARQVLAMRGDAMEELTRCIGDAMPHDEFWHTMRSDAMAHDAIWCQARLRQDTLRHATTDEEWGGSRFAHAWTLHA